MNQWQSSSQDSGISMVQDPRSVKIMQSEPQVSVQDVCMFLACPKVHRCVGLVHVDLPVSVQTYFQLLNFYVKSKLRSIASSVIKTKIFAKL